METQLGLKERELGRENAFVSESRDVYGRRDLVIFDEPNNCASRPTSAVWRRDHESPVLLCTSAADWLLAYR